VLLIGLIGGVAMASVAAGRRTQSSYTTFVRSTNPTDLTMSVYGQGESPYSARLTKTIERLPNVRHVDSWVGVGALPLKPDGAPLIDSPLNPVGSLGLYFDDDRATAVEGRMARADRVDEFVTTALGARILHIHVGSVVPTGVYSLAQLSERGFGTPAVAPRRTIQMKLVGIVELNNEVVEDVVDQRPTDVVYTPALTHVSLHMGATQGTWYGLQFVHGSRDIASVERALTAVIPHGEVANFRVAATSNAKVERAVRPEAIALGLFGAIAGLAAIAVAAQAVAREVGAHGAEPRVLWALGASPATVFADVLAGVLVAIALGTLVADAVAVALSPLAPLGPVRRVYPSAGVAIDRTVLGAGTGILLVMLGAVAVIAAVRTRPRAALGATGVTGVGRISKVTESAAGAGMPAPAVVGLRFALEPGRESTAVPVRAVLVGAIVAVLLVVATVTFGSSFATLVATPPLYGWNWNYALTSVNGVPPSAARLLQRDPDVAGASGYIDADAQIDGHEIAALLGDTRPEVAPPILSGHGLEANRQIVLGTATLRMLHKHVGDTVMAGYGTPSNGAFYLPPIPLTIVGTATLPAVIGSASFTDHVSMGTGALLAEGVLPASFRKAINNPDPTQSGRPLVFVRLKSSVGAAAGRADMQRIATAGDRAFAKDPHAIGDRVEVISVQRPAEIVNYRSTGLTPVVLAAGLAAGAVGSLALTLLSVVRRRRRDLALLKTIGFTRRQVSAVVSAQSTVAAIVGVAIGLPLGVALGRWLWSLFARNIYVVPHPTVSSWVLVGVAFGALALANLVAAIPGFIAGRTPAALVLRNE
jgi:hypothetical protein